MRTLSIDFEFKNSKERNPTILCCSTILRKTDVIIEEQNWWLLDTDPTDFVSYIGDMIDNNVVFLAHYASAECRCLLNYFDERYLMSNLRILDSYVLWKELQQDPQIAYGCRFEKGVKIYSSAPIFYKNGEQYIDETKVYGYYNEETGVTVEDKTYFKTSANKISKASLVEIVANQLEIDLDSEHKDRMRDLILYGNKYSEENKQEIMDYCASDVKYLQPLINKLFNQLPSICTIEEQIHICQWMLSSAIVERNGFPVEIDKFNNFCDNVDDLRQSLMYNCNKVHKFFDKGVKKYQLFADLIEFYNIKDYPLTESGKYKMDKTTLKSYWSYPEIKALWQTVLALGELRYFKNKDKILQNVGSDMRCRVMTSPFGTVTTRNAPSVKAGWFLAMSTWMRSLVSHENLYGCDYSAQEISIMAQISGDINMQQAYSEGDPYSWFAKMAEMVPADANVKKEFRSIRNLCKALMLGKQFGMGAISMANSLTGSRIDSLTKEEKDIIDMSKKDESLKETADEILDYVKIWANDESGIPKKNRVSYYLDLYNNVFPSVKKYGYKAKEDFKKNGYLRLKDGWTIQYFKKILTTSNFEIQGNAAVILREAVRLCILYKIEVVATLHDAIYIIKNKDTDIEILEKCMAAAVRNVMGLDCIRMETGKYTTNWDKLESNWTKDRGSDMLKDYGQYFNDKELF